MQILNYTTLMIIQQQARPKQMFWYSGLYSSVYNMLSVRFYNVQLTASATKTIVGGGQVGSSVVDCDRQFICFANKSSRC
jgi:hypothetical protein